MWVSRNSADPRCAGSSDWTARTMAAPLVPPLSRARCNAGDSFALRCTILALRHPESVTSTHANKKTVALEAERRGTNLNMRHSYGIRSVLTSDGSNHQGQMDCRRQKLGWIERGSLIDTTVTIVGVKNIKPSIMNSLLKHGPVLGSHFSRLSRTGRRNAANFQESQNPLRRQHEVRPARH